MLQRGLPSPANPSAAACPPVAATRIKDEDCVKIVTLLARNGGGHFARCIKIPLGPGLDGGPVAPAQ